MLYREQTPPPQVRHRCRNPRCAGTLSIPADNPRDAFCRPTCEAAFYGCRCRVCEQLITRKTKRRQVCWRTKCRYQFQHHPERIFGGRYPSSLIAHNSEKTHLKSSLKNGAKAGRGWRVVAGPEDLHPINLHDFPVNAAALKANKPGPALIQRTTSPVNVIGGCKWPGAPKIERIPRDLSLTVPAGKQIGANDVYA